MAVVLFCAVFIHSIFFKLVHIRKKLWSDMKMQEGGCVWVMGGEGWIDLCDYIFAHCCIIQPRRLLCYKTNKDNLEKKFLEFAMQHFTYILYISI